MSTAYPSARNATGFFKDTNDGDDDAESNDDNLIVNFGHPPSAVEERTITALLKSYYVAAAAADGAKACALLYSLVAETVAEEFGRELGEPPGASCSTVMSKVLQQRHRQLAMELASLEVTRVRVEGDKGVAVVSFGKTPEPHMFLHHEQGVWKIESLFALRMI